MVPDLISALSDPDPGIRAGAATSLGGLAKAGVAAALDAALPLARILADPEEPETVRSRALAALAPLTCGDPALFGKMAAALSPSAP